MAVEYTLDPQDIASARLLAITRASAAACFEVAPGRRRPLTIKSRSSRLVRGLWLSPDKRGAIISGIYKAGRKYCSTPVKFSGVTPTMPNSMPSTRIFLPTISGAELNSWRQRSWLITATASRPGTASSSRRNARPSCGVTSNTSKKLPLTSSPAFISGVACRSDANPKVLRRNAARPEKTRLRALKSA